jgi:hypothetical protein
MSMQAKLTGSVPGWGEILLTGPTPSTCDLAIKSNQSGSYLSDDGEWRSTPHWHRPYAQVAANDKLRLQVGPTIVDGINSAPGRAVALLLRDSAGQQSEVALALPRRLLGSALAPDAEPPALVDEPKPRPVPTQDRRKRLPWRALLAALALLVTIGIGGWLWQSDFTDTLVERWNANDSKQPDPIIPDSRPDVVESDKPLVESEPVAEKQMVELKPITAPIPVATTAPEPRPTQVTQTSSQPLAAHAHWAEAERLEQAGDCDGAEDRYLQAAEESAQFLYRLARRLDPLVQPRPPCIRDTESSAMWAQNHYDEALRLGVTEAKGPLGEMLLIWSPSSQPRDRVEIERGLALLQEAAQAGDQRARDVLQRYRRQTGESQ